MRATIWIIFMLQLTPIVLGSVHAAVVYPEHEITVKVDEHGKVLTLTGQRVSLSAVGRTFWVYVDCKEVNGVRESCVGFRPPAAVCFRDGKIWLDSGEYVPPPSGHHTFVSANMAGSEITEYSNFIFDMRRRREATNPEDRREMDRLTGALNRPVRFDVKDRQLIVGDRLFDIMRLRGSFTITHSGTFHALAPLEVLAKDLGDLESIVSFTVIREARTVQTAMGPVTAKEAAVIAIVRKG